MKFPEYIKPTAWGAIAGAVAMMIVGFWGMGWTTESGARRLAKQTSEEAVLTALIPFCVAKAKLDVATLTKFEAEASSYTRSQIVTAAGWADLRGDKSTDFALARACSEKLATLKAN